MSPAGGRDRLRLRGPRAARDELFPPQPPNLRKLVNLIPSLQLVPQGGGEQTAWLSARRKLRFFQYDRSPLVFPPIIGFLVCRNQRIDVRFVVGSVRLAMPDLR